MLPTTRLFVLAFSMFLVVPLKAAEIRLSLPPDPNALPVFVLEAKRAQFLPEDDLILISNPAGDPSGMRALIQGRRVDFTLFNLVSGVRFVQGGMNDMSLVTPWVWKGIYLLQPVGAGPIETLDTKKVLVAPGTSTPPHVVTERALARMGIRPDFVTGGAGAVLMEQLRTSERAPSAVAAPEPLVSLILDRQDAQRWEQRWEIRLDPAQQLGGTIPLGALWQAHPDVESGIRDRLVAALGAVGDWLKDPDNHAEAAAIGSARYREFFRMPVPEDTLLEMLRMERVHWETATDDATRQIVVEYLDEVFEIVAPQGLFLQ